MAAPRREPAGRSPSLRVTVTQGSSLAQTAALPKSLGQQREDGKGEFFCLVGVFFSLFFFPQRKILLAVSWQGREAGELRCKIRARKRPFTDFLNICL